MSDCKKKELNLCRQSSGCKVASGDKRKYCRRAKNRPRCPKTMRRNQRTSNCEPYHKRKQTQRKQTQRDLIQFDYSPLRESMLKQYDIQAESFFTDPCVLLKKLKRYVGNQFYNLTEERINTIKKVIPTLERENQNTYLFGKHKVILGNKIGSGSYGDIYKAKYNGSNIILKVPKPGKFDYREFITETIIQNELFCRYRGSWGSGVRIPKIEFFAKMKIHNRRIVGVIAMESLDNDMWHILENTSESEQQKKMFRDFIFKLSTFLLQLQQNHQFVHRDLHAGNIMYKKVGNSYRWYIIDFGMTLITLNGTPISATSMYRGYNVFNASHDLRMLFLSMFDVLRRRHYNNMSVPKSIFVFLYACMKSLARYLPTNENALFHNAYRQVIKVHDIHFTPQHILNVFANKETMLIANHFKRDTAGNTRLKRILNETSKYVQ